MHLPNYWINRMLIGVNVRLLIKNRVDGIARFTYETMKRITGNHPEHRFIFFFDRPFPDEFIFHSNVKPVVVHPQTRRPFLNEIWFEWTLPRALARHRPDLLVSTDGLLPLKIGTPSLPVIHDLNFEHFPEYLPANYLRYYKKRLPLFAQKAVRVATVSEYSKQDIAELYRIDPDRIDVVYNGVSEKFVPASPAQIEVTRKKYTRGLPYFLFVGSLHPRKNIKNTLLAFDIYRSTSSEKKMFLIAGEKSYWTVDMQEAYDSMQFRDDVVFTGKVSDDELVKLYGSADSVVYASLFEGFGIPLLEAMRSRVPVITSDLTSMPEVAGDAALLANPHDPHSIGEKMLQLDNIALRNALIEKGLKRTELFTWDHSASLLWDSIEKAYNQIHTKL